ncbi:hypothetical protein FRACYDRAFT_237902 [Fragilariopsis cylindrus CCMP1102]|uniref:Uncharacterized protein n=1 Tax=Fragilariopsis cylindrus CCMP1102 TaxID=635003 RepID=A0A1E7FH29_9STRA|nr:hypothetical protein FRACYDRAFT_237902 [Fragilariopsis cylindrus CCMP1102]|eukprot:OEU17482.1 hypothetical protein FRACYDRAFT_237902 [Fragilariopsis cylindrus CCMP1102]
MTKLLIIFLAAALLTLSSVSGFAPQLHQPTSFASTSTSTQLDAAPTMSAIDYVGYATGQTDKWQGTGVWKGLKVSRDDEEGDDGSPKNPPPSKKEEEKTAPKSS